MRNRLFITFFLCITTFGASRAQDLSTLWQIGVKDKSAAEFALGEYDYSKYQSRFGGNTVIYEPFGGKNKPTDFPFVLPGPDDAWAGYSSKTVIINFGIKSLNAPCIARLEVDFTETHQTAPPTLEIAINDFRQDVHTPEGADLHYFDNRRLNEKTLRITVDVPADVLKQGDNFVSIRSKSGSWVVFDCLSLQTSAQLSLAATTGELFFSGAKAEPALVYGKNGELRQPLSLTVVNTGAKQTADLLIDGQSIGKKTFAKGVNTIEASLPEVAAPSKINLMLKGKTTATTEIEAFPVKKTTVYLVQHTHTDIGYTKPQTEILREHIRYIDYAIEYCELTENEPDDARFRWTCEAAWAVREYLHNRPKSQIDKLLKYIRNGQIEVTGMFFNMAEIADENSFKTFLEPIKEFRSLDIPVVTAMQNDVNGIAWCLADYMPDLGIKYFSMGENNHRALIPFDRPTIYKWESPSGKQVFSYRSDHYMTGNFWGLSNADITVDALSSKVFDYLSGIFNREYPFDAVSVQYSGYFTDNSPPSMHESAIIRKWNEKYAYPRLRSAVFHEFMDYITSKYADRLPVHRVAYPDWWTDGFGSAARETAAARLTHADMVTIQGLLAMAVAKGQPLPTHTFDAIRHIHENLLFYDEHTYGAAESIRDPLCENSQTQWAEKGSYAWEALKNAQIMYETSAGLLQGFIPRGDNPTVAFFNTLNHPRSGVVELYIDYEIIPAGRAFRIVDERGGELRKQFLRSRSEGAYYAIYADNIPPMGYRTYSIIASEKAPETLPNTVITNYTVENEYYTMTIDPTTGAISRLYDKQLQLEMLDPASPWQLGAFILESLKGNRRQMELYRLTEYERTGLSDVKISAGTNGAVYQTVNIEGKSACCENGFGVHAELRLFHAEKRIELHFAVKLLPHTDPEGIYVAFPFQLNDAKLFFDVQGGVVSPGVNQLEATANDWNTVQNFVAARNSQSQIIVGSNAIPLFQMGGIGTGTYKRHKTIEKPHVYSWVTNNYWTTNFRASQEGELRWSYYLTSVADASNAVADRFGRDARTPLFARVMPKGKPNGQPAEFSALRFNNENLVLTSITPSNEAGYLLINVREPDGKPATLQLTASDGSPLTFTVVNALEEILAAPVKELNLKPYENVFIKVKIE
ncbi:MAG: hypothetical protein LBR06_05295 [Bacteroidales bacterium]|jgi:hypothetical protein|nr:hypothetical protein [Bacteroidales bacterium]